MKLLSYTNDVQDFCVNNVELRLIKMLHDYDFDIHSDSDLRDMFDKYPNCSFSSIFNDPLFVTRELFQSVKHLFKDNGMDFTLNVGSDLSVKLLAVRHFVIQDFFIGFEERLCQCHGEPINKPRANQTVCGKTMKIIDSSDTLPAMTVGKGSTRIVVPSVIDESSHTKSIDGEMKVKGKFKTSSFPYETMIGPPFILVPSLDMELTLLEANEQKVGSLSSVIIRNNEALLCESTFDEEGYSITGSNVVFHYLIVGDKESRCLFMYKLASMDDLIPSMFLSPLSIDPEVEQRIENSIANIETFEEFNPLNFCSNKIAFMFKNTNLQVKQDRRFNEPKIVPVARRATQPQHNLVSQAETITIVDHEERPKKQRAVKKISFR